MPIRAVTFSSETLIQFMGTHTSRFDAKGRMSIPAPFRQVLRELSGDGAAPLVLRPSHEHPCIEAWPRARFEAFAAQLAQLDAFSADEDDLATTIFGDAYQVEPDKEGRIVVNDFLIAHAGLEGAVACMGQGNRFQIWEPEAAAQRRLHARRNTVARGIKLPGVKS